MFVLSTSQCGTRDESTMQNKISGRVQCSGWSGTLASLSGRVQCSGWSGTLASLTSRVILKKSIANLDANDLAKGYGRKSEAIPLPLRPSQSLRAFPGIETCQISISEKCPGTLRNIKTNFL
jgi:hypothetical protein